MESPQYWPLSRTDKYPRHLAVDFRKLPLATTERYIKAYNVPVRPDCTTSELQVAAGRHFEAHLDADEDEVTMRFMNTVKRVGNDAGKRGRRTPMKQSRHERKAAQQARARQLEDQEYAEEEEEVVVEDDGDAPPLYCHCKRPDFGEMIACDNDSCTIEWFHLGCVGLTPSTRPAAHEEWYCPECRLAQEPVRAVKGKGKGGSKKRRGGGAGAKGKRGRF